MRRPIVMIVSLAILWPFLSTASLAQQSNSAGTANPQDRVLKAELRTAVLATPVSSVGVIEPPVLPSEISQYYLPVTVTRPSAIATLIYEARLYGAAEVVFLDKKKGKETRLPYRLLTQAARDGETIRWATSF